MQIEIHFLNNITKKTGQKLLLEKVTTIINRFYVSISLTNSLFLSLLQTAFLVKVVSIRPLSATNEINVHTIMYLCFKYSIQIL